jgi:hypothetical protein
MTIGKRVASAIALVSITAITFAVPARAAGMDIAEERYGSSARTPALKLGPALTRLVEDYRAHVAGGTSAAGFQPADVNMRVAGGRVLVEAASEDAAALVEAMTALGIEGAAHYGRVVSGWVDIDALERLAEIPGLHLVRPSYVRTHTGSVTSQGA